MLAPESDLRVPVRHASSPIWDPRVARLKARSDAGDNGHRHEARAIEKPTSNLASERRLRRTQG